MTELEEEKLLRILKEHKTAIGCTIADIRGISPSLCMHKILMEENFMASVESQHRLNHTLKEVDTIRSPLLPKTRRKPHSHVLMGPSHLEEYHLACVTSLPTFQRCMMAIFSDMVEQYIEVFMDDFSVSGDAFDICLTNLSKGIENQVADHLSRLEHGEATDHVAINEVFPDEQILQTGNAP
ncbi:Uncharacterized protein Adt_40052 [Abeliophyllum distichum]|uniref:Uncharacterized protein n=1 Tax=Abeliophyllum distichum TaxID=126358 RepID=A0ABD1Q6X6_9LAMI